MRYFECIHIRRQPAKFWVEGNDWELNLLRPSAEEIDEAIRLALTFGYKITVFK